MSGAIQDYLRVLQRDLDRGNATEHTYRPVFKALVESFGKGITATNEPRRVACGAPDFVVARGDLPIGHIECKDLGTPLDEAEESEQLQRYFGSLENLILTDYLEFRYYVRGEPRIQVTLANPSRQGRIKAIEGAEADLATLFDAFLSARPGAIGTPRELAARMANVAKVIRDAIEKAFTLEAEAGTLHGELESFRATILSDINPKQFADMYAQTVCYGMFSARVNVPDQKAESFTREHAAYDLPATNPFLREVFEYIAGTKLDPSIVWAVDLLAEILRRCEMTAILKDFGRASRREDPVVHFYETFLAAYDPALRQSRGVYYTPQPVVSYIVRSIDAILKRDFGLPQGLADNSKVTVEVAAPARKGGKAKQEVHRVQILDPATGTGTFLYETVRHIHETLRPNRGVWAGERGYVARHLLPRLHGFELMMAPYAVAHLKLGWLLKETGYGFAPNERLRVYLTNTLEEAEVVAGPLLALANQIAREANAASKVKTECPIMVVLGNPPYSGHSANQNQWSRDLIKKRLPFPDGAPGYFECDGKPLGERNPKWLNDDYVKFIRFGQYRIERTGYGILAFITNHSYLDNPTFRGMRQSLMRTFDDIYVLDLHGNSKKKETSPDGSKDENVFDIMQGVAIGVFVRRPKKVRVSARVAHADCWGTRARKYAWLLDNDTSTTRWAAVPSDGRGYVLVPKSGRRSKEYSTGWAIVRAMPVSTVGVVTGQDKTVLSMSREEAAQRAGQHRLPDSSVSGLLYRPYDLRWLPYDKSVVTRPRMDVMRHMLEGPNLGLIVTRQTRDQWDVFVTRRLCGHKACAAFDINTLVPLYLYGNGSLPPTLFELHDARRPNLSTQFVEEIAKRLGLRFISEGMGDLRNTFGPEDVLHYAYAVFHSPEYRRRYAEFLRIDFPRLPMTGDRKLFWRLCALGAELVGLHLLERVPDPQATYPQVGSSLVGKPHYKPPTDEGPGRVYVNDSQYFDGVPPDVWEFHVGGYQVCEKWLKDRKGRTLGYDDIEHYRKTTEALRQTIRVMAEIDRAIPSWPL